MKYKTLLKNYINVNNSSCKLLFFALVGLTGCNTKANTLQMNSSNPVPLPNPDMDQSTMDQSTFDYSSYVNDTHDSSYEDKEPTPMEEALNNVIDQMKEISLTGLSDKIKSLEEATKLIQKQRKDFTNLVKHRVGYRFEHIENLTRAGNVSEMKDEIQNLNQAVRTIQTDAEEQIANITNAKTILTDIRNLPTSSNKDTAAISELSETCEEVLKWFIKSTRETAEVCQEQSTAFQKLGVALHENVQREVSLVNASQQATPRIPYSTDKDMMETLLREVVQLHQVIQNKLIDDEKKNEDFTSKMNIVLNLVQNNTSLLKRIQPEKSTPIELVGAVVGGVGTTALGMGPKAGSKIGRKAGKKVSKFIKSTAIDKKEKKKSSEKE